MKFLKQALKRVKLRTLITLLLLLIFNAYAWFVYTSRVSTGVSAHIEAWEIVFQEGSNENVSKVEFNVGRIFPGMEPVTKEITAYNRGEKPAYLEYKILEVTILGELYVVEEGKVTVYDEEGLNPIEMTVEEFLDTFPFKITIKVSNDGEMEAGTGTSVIKFSAIWDFTITEGDPTPEEIEEKDILDTKWGQKAYEYYKEVEELGGNEEELLSSIILLVELKATQVTEP